MRTDEDRLNLPPKKAGTAAGLGMARSGAFKHIDYTTQQLSPSASMTAGTLPRSAQDTGEHAAVHPKQQKRFVPNSLLSLIALDVTFISLAQALILTYLHQRLNLEGAEQITVVILLSLLFTMGSLYASGSYRRDSLSRFSTAIAPLAVAIGLAATLLILTMNFALAAMYPDMAVYRSISRCFTITLIMTAIALPICSVNRACYFAMVRRHWFVRRVLVVGTGTRAAYLETLLGSDTHRAHSQLFFLSESALGGSPAAHAAVQSDVLNSGKPVEDVAAELGADEVVIAVDEKRGLAIERLLSCKTNGIPIIEYDALIERETGRIDLRWLELSWLVYSPGFEIKLLDTILKRTLDLVVSAGLLIVSLPAMLMAMAAIKFEDRGPLFYKQTRVTQGGREFWIYKLRTMRVDAEAKGAQWAAKNDSRTTRVGNFLRKSRIDEIPQLWNVLAGDMSLVGPRPERPIFIEQLSKQIPMYNFRHGVKAGLTGWAQINYPYGASVEDARAKLEYDLYYMKNYNVLRDLSIMLQTFRILVWRGGAR